MLVWVHCFQTGGAQPRGVPDSDCGLGQEDHLLGKIWWHHNPISRGLSERVNYPRNYEGRQTFCHWGTRWNTSDLELWWRSLLFWGRRALWIHHKSQDLSWSKNYYICWRLRSTFLLGSSSRSCQRCCWARTTHINQTIELQGSKCQRKCQGKC